MENLQTTKSPVEDYLTFEVGRSSVSINEGYPLPLKSIQINYGDVTRVDVTVENAEDFWTWAEKLNVQRLELSHGSRVVKFHWATNGSTYVLIVHVELWSNEPIRFIADGWHCVKKKESIDFLEDTVYTYVKGVK